MNGRIPTILAAVLAVMPAKASTTINPVAPSDTITIVVGEDIANLDDVRLGDLQVDLDRPKVSRALTELGLMLRAFLSASGHLQGAERARSLPARDASVAVRRSIPGLDAGRSLWKAPDLALLEQKIAELPIASILFGPSRQERAILLYGKISHDIAVRNLASAADNIDLLRQIDSTQELVHRSEFQIALDHFKSRRYGSALERCFALSRTSTDAHVRQDAAFIGARSAQEQGDHSTAKAGLRSFVRTWPSSKWGEGARFFLAKAEFRTGEKREAIATAEAFIQSYPNSVYRDDARELAATCYEQVGDLANALRSFEKYREENPSPLDQMAAERRIFLYAQSLLKDPGVIASSPFVYKYRRIVEDYPSKVQSLMTRSGRDIELAQGLFELSQYHLGANNPQQAVVVLRQLFDKRFSTDKTIKNHRLDECDCKGLIYRPLIDFNLGRAYVELGMPDSTESILQRLLKDRHFTLASRLCVDMSEANKRLRRWQEAEASLLRADQLNKGSEQLTAEIQLRLGLLRWSEGRFNESRAILNRVIERYGSMPIAEVAKNMLDRVPAR